MSPLLQMRDVRLVYGRRRPTLAIEGLDLEIDRGEIRCRGRAVRLRQVVADEARYRVAAAERGQHRGRGQGGERTSENRRHGLSESYAAALAHDTLERHAAARDRRAASPSVPARARALPAASERAAQPGGAGEFRREVSMAAVRRHAAARFAVPLAHSRAGLADARRAVRRARCLYPRGAVGRTAGALDAARLHHDSGDARPARSGLSRRYRARDVEPARTHHRHPRRADRTSASAAHRL